MKYVKYLIVALVITSVMAITGVSAAIYQSFVSFSLPSWQGTVDAGTLTKTDEGVHVVGVLSTQDSRDIQVRLYGPGVLENYGTSPWVTIEVPYNSTTTDYSVVSRINTQTSSDAYGMFPGNVTMTMKARNTHLSATWFNGTWYVSEDVYNQLNL